MTTDFRDFHPCILIPTYDNPATLRGVVERVRRDSPGVPILVVDDHSGPEGQRAVEVLASEGLIQSRRLSENRGKGGAVKAGFAFAHELGFTHALQVDADGQHCFEDIPRFLDAARAHPSALVLGAPIFDETAPTSRLRGRQISIFWTTLETGFRRVIDDPCCGFRVYPVEAALAAQARSDRMEFDPEIAVRMVWNGVPVLNLPTKVRYLTADEGGVSHFRPLHDNVLMSWMHTRMVCTLIARAVLGLLGLRPRVQMRRIEASNR
ncbi:MAG: glycosyltransferase family 2 protein [Myxococcales bacterium]|jgi:glycosyltransferase involved in cell wall biosynthesis|nr:glycosyltransferase family 2 protein [Myxococcales bacterium]